MDHQIPDSVSGPFFENAYSDDAHTAPPTANTLFTLRASPRPIKAPSRALYQYVRTQIITTGYAERACPTTARSGVKLVSSGVLISQNTHAIATNTPAERRLSAAPAPDAAASPSDTCNREVTAFDTVVMAPAATLIIDRIWNRSTCAAPENTPVRAAKADVPPHTRTTFITRPNIDVASRKNFHANTLSKA